MDVSAGAMGKDALVIDMNQAASEAVVIENYL